MPGREELELFDPTAVVDAARSVDGVLHLATRIRSLEQISDPDAWREDDRASRGRFEDPRHVRLRPGVRADQGHAPAVATPERL
jgi:hypothetical protein